MLRMNARIYREVTFDASHRLLNYEGKCSRLHGHRWRVQVWMIGNADESSGILLDYNVIKELIERFDHQVILNEYDPMVVCLREFQPVCTTAGDPTSERLAVMIRGLINEWCQKAGLEAKVECVRVWESPGCYAEA
jgi:6-pyruvoyltetrahydropterin/6-carboxytetrahydropterin synthase